MYKVIGGSAIAIIIALGVWFNMPKANNQLVDGITVDTHTVPPDLQSISGFINTKPIYHLAQEKGLVVLIHFWRIGCPECQSDMGFINYLYQKYHSFGLVILGIHSPQFDYEKNYNAILQAVKQYGIKYPVLIDNSKATWTAYGDEFWPRDALIGSNGFERFAHIGIGDQAEMENNIRYLLTARNVSLTH